MVLFLSAKIISTVSHSLRLCQESIVSDSKWSVFSIAHQAVNTSTWCFVPAWLFPNAACCCWYWSIENAYANAFKSDIIILQWPGLPVISCWCFSGHVVVVTAALGMMDVCHEHAGSLPSYSFSDFSSFSTASNSTPSSPNTHENCVTQIVHKLM